MESKKILESSDGKTVPPPPEDIYSSRKHSMDYVTVDGVILRTGYTDMSDWYLLCIREFLDNSIDFLWKYYKGAEKATVTVDITIDDSLFHIKVRNTNGDNKPVFQNLQAILDYNMRYGSKQNQHIISRGILGDAMKQIATWPYVLIHTKDDGSAFTDRQWDKPLIIRSNRVERHILIHIDKANQIIEANPITQLPGELAHTDTEIETTWPIIDDVNQDIHKIEEYCRKYIIFTTDISFQFRLTDNSYDESDNDNDNNNNYTEDTKVTDDEYESRSIIPKKRLGDLSSEFADVLSSPARKATIKIDAPRLHPINMEWKNNTSSIGTYKPEEFVAIFTTIYDKESTIVYDVLRTISEGNNIEKDSSNNISVAELLSDPKKFEKIEALYYKLKNILDPPESKNKSNDEDEKKTKKRLSLPYSNIKADERKAILVERIIQIYGSNNLDTGKAVYKIIHDEVNDNLLHYPFAIEVVAIPFSREIILNSEDHGSRFISAVNYSVPPRINKFDGEYKWTHKSLEDIEIKANSIVGILEKNNFEFGDDAGSGSKLPCIIAMNLISPRIDYHGQDKSRINTQPFAKTIIKAVSKLAAEIPTFSADGYRFSKVNKKQKRTFDPHYGNSTGREALKVFLRARRNEVLGY